MLETVVVGLLLAAVSGITYLAYKHSLAYRKLWTPLWMTLLGIQLLISAWTFGAMQAHTTLIPLIEMAKQHEAQQAIDNLVPRWWIVSVICLGAILYLSFLRVLPDLLKDEQDKSQTIKARKKKTRKPDLTAAQLISSGSGFIESF